MKTSLLTLAITACAFTAATAQTAILQGDITANRTLSADTCYVMKGCVNVQAPATLTIPAGTKILGDKLTQGALIVHRGAYIIANGTSSNPIVFSSSQPAGSRNRGDWGGIIIAGRARNNQTGGTFTVEGPCTPVTAGGTNDADSSGIMRFVQIHYAGISVGGQGTGNEINSLTLASVGSRTVIENIQVTFANDDAFEWFGGTVNCKNLISYNTLDDDFDTDFGYRGNVQFGFAYRRDTSSHDVSGSNGFESDNNAAGNSDTPQTRPTFSNMTILGPLYANAGPVHGDFRRGAHIRRNSAQRTYNSVIAGWPLEGLYIDGASTQNNTNSILNFSANSFQNNNGAAVDYGHTPAAWTGCPASMADWLFTAGGGCQETGNLNLAAAPGYHASLRTAVCPARPSFVLSSNNLGAPDYTSGDLAAAFFVKTGTFRGAFGGTDWTLGWTNWCPQATVYCNGAGAGALRTASPLQLIPNPSSGVTYAVFTAPKAGQARLAVLDKVTGQPLRSVTVAVTAAGEQRISFDASGLATGIYLVRVEMDGGFSTTAQLSVN